MTRFLRSCFAAAVLFFALPLQAQEVYSAKELRQILINSLQASITSLENSQKAFSDRTPELIETAARDLELSYRIANTMPEHSPIHIQIVRIRDQSMLYIDSYETLVIDSINTWQAISDRMHGRLLPQINPLDNELIQAYASFILLANNYLTFHLQPISEHMAVASDALVFGQSVFREDPTEGEAQFKKALREVEALRELGSGIQRYLLRAQAILASLEDCESRLQNNASEIKKK